MRELTRMESLVSVAALSFWSALFMMLLWNAFMPVLFGLPVLSYWGAAGCQLVVSYMVMRIDTTKMTLDRMGMTLMHAVFLPPFMGLLGLLIWFFL